MKKNWAVWSLVIIVVLGVIFVITKPKSPTQGSIAIVTEKASDVLPLPLLQDVVARYVLDSDSVLTWTSRKVGGQHNGTIAFSEGALAIDASGAFVGKFVVDMNTIAVSDLTGDDAQSLLSKLRGEFFSVDAYPIASFSLKQVTNIQKDTYDVVGDLLLKGVSKEIRFPATMTITDAGITLQADFSIDRTQWGLTEWLPAVDTYIEIGMDVRMIKK